MKHRQYSDDSGELVFHEYTIFTGSKEAAIDAATTAQPLFSEGPGHKFCKVDNVAKLSPTAWLVTLVIGWDV
jgi:hypothetical protein